MVLAGLFVFAACAEGRPVEAPVTDVAIGAVDAGATPSAPIAVAPPQDEAEFAGRWEGIGVQDDGQSWDMIVTFDASRRGECAKAEYPTIPCHARWLCTSDLRGVVTAREKLEGDSAQRCIDSGSMTMTLLAKDVIDWTWSGQGQTARARLRRTR